MKRRINLIIGCFFIILFVCGCSDKSQNLNSKELNELKDLIKANNEAIKELSNKNTELENKIALLEDENKKLKESATNIEKKVTSLEDSDKNINSTVKSNYDELKKLINSKVSSSNTSSYTISKSQLLGTWNYIDYNSPITFTNDNVEVINNWIIFKNNSGNYRTLFYMYRNGQLYITDDGGILKK